MESRAPALGIEVHPTLPERVYAALADKRVSKRRLDGLWKSVKMAMLTKGPRPPRYGPDPKVERRVWWLGEAHEIPLASWQSWRVLWSAEDGLSYHDFARRLKKSRLTHNAIKQRIRRLNAALKRANIPVAYHSAEQCFIWRVPS